MEELSLWPVHRYHTIGSVLADFRLPPNLPLTGLLAKVERVEAVLENVQVLVKKLVVKSSHGKAREKPRREYTAQILNLISGLAAEIQEIKTKIVPQNMTQMPDESSLLHPASRTQEAEDENQSPTPCNLPTSIAVSPTRPRTDATTLRQSSHADISLGRMRRASQLGTIPYRTEHGVIVLMPSDLDQCRNIPLLLSQAKSLGARETGIFKYVLPDDYISVTPGIPATATNMSKFKSELLPNCTFRISRIETGRKETLNISDNNETPTEPDNLGELLESRIGDYRTIAKIRYAPDLPARTLEERKLLGLPEEPPIYPLKDNLLEHTKYSVPGLHWPYGYISNNYGSLFTMHQEDGKLVSLNVLHQGVGKLWYAVAQKDGYRIENEVKHGVYAQKVRHASYWIPQSRLKAIGASFVSVLQRQREVVVVWGDTYHQGGAISPTIAEAVNYGEPGWSIEGYRDCQESCPGFPIPNHYLEFRGSDELPLEQENEISEPDHEPACPPITKKGPSSMRTRTSLSTKRRREEHDTEPSARAKKFATSPQQIVADNTTIVTLVKAIKSHSALVQFCNLVASMRERGSNQVEMARSLPSNRLIRHIRHIDTSTKRSTLERFAVRAHQISLAEELEPKDGRLRADESVISSALKQTNWTRPRLHHHKKMGRKWTRVYGKYVGLLCFLFLEPKNSFNITEHQYLEMRDKDLHQFHALLQGEYVTALYSAGKLFQENLDSGVTIPEFLWEAKGIALDKVSIKDLLPFSVVSTNIHNAKKYPDWVRPKGWPDD